MSKNKFEGTREGFGRGLLVLGETNARIVTLTADLANSTRADLFKKKFPERFFDFGIAEQNMMSAAAGMSLCGYIPYVCTYGIFSAGRCWDQLRMSICYSDCNVKIEGAHSGVTVGPDGASHQGLEDIGLTRIMPNLKVIVPCDSIEAEKATIATADISGPVYIRVGREPTAIITDKITPFVFGKANVIKEGKDVMIIACGIEVAEAIVAAEELKKEGINASVINVHTLKPIDEETIIKKAKETRAVVTVEEHQVSCGLGGAVGEVLSQHYPVPMEMVGIRDSFGESGKPRELMEKFGLTSISIIQAVKKVIKRK